eukprot:663563-Rhodomonas_salina.3
MDTDLSADFATTASIHVALERETYTAGDLVRGYAQLQNLREKQMRSMSVELTGQSQTAIEFEKTGRNAGISVSQEAHTFLQARVEAATFQHGTIPVGTFQCPFEIQLPQTAPGSMLHIQKFPALTDGHSVRIVYFVSVRCHPADSDTDFLARAVPIDVYAKPPASTSSVHVTDDRITTSCLCCAAGRVQMTLRANKPSYADDEVIQAEFELASQGKWKAGFADVSLVRETRWTAKDKEVTKTSVEFIERFPDTTSSTQSVPVTLRDGLPPSVHVGSLRISYALTLSAPSEKSSRAPKSNRNRRPDLTLPVSITRSAPSPTHELLQGWKGAGREHHGVSWEPSIPYAPDPALSVERLVQPGVLARVLDAD